MHREQCSSTLLLELLQQQCTECREHSGESGDLVAVGAGLVQNLTGLFPSETSRRPQKMWSFFKKSGIFVGTFQNFQEFSRQKMLALANNCAATCSGVAVAAAAGVSLSILSTRENQQILISDLVKPIPPAPPLM